MVLTLLLIICLALEVRSNEEGRLIEKLLGDYDKRIKPAKTLDHVIDVTLKLTLTNLISLNEKEEALTTNVWIEIQWNDYRLSWNTSEYEGIDLVRIPSELLWLPDVVLENNVDGQFEVAYYANVLVYNDGSMYWLPPAIYRSTCPIAVTYFPFDWQNCSLVFRSQTYNAHEVNLQLSAEEGEVVEWIHIDPEDFTENGEWTIRHRPAKKNYNWQLTKDDIDFQEIIFFLIIQRKPLFYIINIIAPCVLISSLVVLVYFLPAQAGGQKCTLSISVLLAQTIFLFLIAQKVPETSLNVPLIGKYLIFVMFVSLVIVTNCVIVLNVSLRTPNTHSLSEKIKHLFLEFLPKYLGMHLEPSEETPEKPQPRRRSSFGIMIKAEEYILKKPRSELMFEEQKDRHGLKRVNKMTSDIDIGTTVDLYKDLANFAPEIKSCVEACNFIAKSTKEQNDSGSENENWVLIGKVIDKACFWIALLLFSLGTLAIFLTGHLNQVPEFPFPGDPRKYVP
uniref:Acetylcholine receptor gamma subunit n=2 Tax=Torpedo marmorata TaxID=7788 RepID=Q6S3H9_TORMA|nr:Chain 3, Acetylcholine receptor gamma subunit [Torpedo marmorata]4BOG_E Chain E, Acetylcholine receptor gamma subunit [Torpedo marmorata]4BOG_J Chain J, Acetylcholine receptor gamma subunit [Torpedo marmorata]4BOG_O Chain O, Acetylcholine receptor gamma subunit [Torpedo marmorata]4BOG_T Chain T, Acetylcholine receptor gamma subunit [Torpedo marmorata]4BOG_Y Chain Y, Acetylcholine receptor gamma subunit [Torpedo marmorata]4BOI_E Chain E, Acetylcholine Receptor Gamma Subunit [Torpedo marmora